MKKSRLTGKRGRRFVSTVEMGPLLGVSPRTIRNWIHSGHIRGHRIGHNLKISKDEAIRILERFEQPVPREW